MGYAFASLLERSSRLPLEGVPVAGWDQIKAFSERRREGRLAREPGSSRDVGHGPVVDGEQISRAAQPPSAALRGDFAA